MKNITVIILGAIIIILFGLLLNTCNEKKRSDTNWENVIAALSDTLRTERNEKGELVGRIASIETQNTNQFLELQTKDAQIIELQELVRENKKKLNKGGSATTGTINTNVSNTSSTVITKTDTVRIDSLVYLYPTYTHNLENEWINYKASMNKDSATFSLQVKNDFSLVLGREKNKPYAEITLKNPYSEVSKLRTYQVSLPKQKKFGLGLSAGIAIGKDIKPTPYMGVGLNYNLISF